MARTFQWTPAKERAVALERSGRFSQREIAEQLGTTRRTVEGWMRRPAVRARLAELAAVDRQRWDAEWAAKLAAIRAETERQYAAFDAGAFIAERQAAWQRRARR